jgi:glycosyltransferase involved in cell wall biosynthesis
MALPRPGSLGHDEKNLGAEQGATFLRVLTFTSLFPNKMQPQLGIFVYNRIAAFAQRSPNTVQVVAPVPYFPAWWTWSSRHFLSEIPRQEKIGELVVFHPRYLLLPKVSMLLHGWLMFLGTWRVVRRLHQKTDFDWIDAHYVFPDGFAAVHLGRRLGVRVSVSARGTDINLFPSFRLIRPMVCWTLRNAAALVAVSTALKDRMVALGLPVGRIRVIGNGIDAGRFRVMDRGVARRHLGLPEATRMIVSVGGLSPHKGFQLLVRAFAHLAPKYPELTLHIVGEGECRTELEELIRELGLETRAFLIGSQPNEQLLYWYNAAEIACLASTREGAPNVLLESIACGTPVVATRVGGIPEIVSSEQIGVLADPDSRSIAAALDAALSKSWDREYLASVGRSRTWATVAEEVEEYLKSTMNGQE